MSDILLLGVDLGAGSLKSTVISGDGKVLATASVAVETLTPKPGFSEQDPEGWWSALVESLQKI
ncbi:FGGY family carbohydrate kinase, partial [Shinella sp.]